MPRFALLAAFALATAPTGVRAQIVVSIEAAGVQESPLSASSSAVATFNTTATSTTGNNYQTLVITPVPTPLTTFTYTSGGAGAVAPPAAIRINAADNFGGARTAVGSTTGTNYFVTGSPSGQPTATLSVAQAGNTGGGNYFGLWMSAFDNVNNIDFYRAGQLIATFSGATLVGSSKITSAYFGNPRNGQNTSQPYAFVNFYFANNPQSRYDQVVFRNGNVTNGFESDNHTVGYSYTPTSAEFATLSGGSNVIQILTTPVPEPATALAAGAGLLALGGLLRRSAA